MKKIIILMAALLFVKGYSQECIGECETIDMNFPPTQGGILYNGWTASHGSPGWNPGSVWMWSKNNRGEGVNFSGYTFQEGHEYCITFTGETSTHDGSDPDPDARLNVIATQTPVVGTITSSGGQSIPNTPSPYYIVANPLWSGLPLNGTQNYSYTFTASQDFNNLWFHPSSPSTPQVEFRLSNLQICEIPPCELDFNITMSEHSGGKTLIGVNHTSSSPNINMQIIKNGNLVHSGLPISYLATPGSYEICLTAFDLVDCFKCFSFCIEGWEDGDSDPLPDFSPEEEQKDASIESLLSEDAKNMATLSPNPAKNEVTVVVPDKKTIQQVSIKGLSGQIVYDSKFSEPRHSQAVDVSKLFPGVYFVTIVDNNNNIQTRKLIID